MAGVLNGDGDQPAEMFPGIANPTTTHAGGSVASRTPPPDADPPDSDSGTPGGSGNIVPLREQAISGRSASTGQPGQNDGSVIMGGDGEEPGYTDSGARSGSSYTDPWPRYSWQQPAH